MLTLYKGSVNDSIVKALTASPRVRDLVITVEAGASKIKALAAAGVRCDPGGAVKYICCRCDTRSDSALGHHVCVAPTDELVAAAIAMALGLEWCECARGVTYPSNDDIDFSGADPYRCMRCNRRYRDRWSLSMDACLRDLAPIALARGYRWSLSSVGDGTEYRATFEAHLGNPAPSVLDTTPARAFARGFLRIPKESEGEP